jgi:hypothetical protein
MADVVATCEKCGAFVQAAHVYANGLVGFDPEPTAKHWAASPVCRGSYGLVSVDSLKVAQDSARAGISGPGGESKASLLDRLAAAFHRWRLGKPAPRRG